jgi:hypothetical protein
MSKPCIQARCKTKDSGFHAKIFQEYIEITHRNEVNNETRMMPLGNDYHHHHHHHIIASIITIKFKNSYKNVSFQI